MKTVNVDEAAMEYCKYNGLCDKSWEDAFKAGVAFAQRWIPVEEELPAKKGKSIFSNLVIAKINSLCEEPYVLTCYDYKDDRWNYSIYEVTHWRKIELK